MCNWAKGSWEAKLFTEVIIISIANHLEYEHSVYNLNNNIDYKTSTIKNTIFKQYYANF